MRFILMFIIFIILASCGGDNYSNNPVVSPLTLIDFEGIASGTELSEERFTYQQYGEFQTYIWEGFYFPVNVVPNIHPNSDSDNALTQRLEITNINNENFRIESVQIAERVNNINLAPVKITGYHSDGETIEQVFNADELFGFETLNFDESWNNLTKVDFYVDLGFMHFDNVVVRKNISEVP